MATTVLRPLEKVAGDPEGLLWPATDGSVFAENLEGLVFPGTADTSGDSHFRAAFLTFNFFATRERLFETLRRRFESTELGPTHARSRYK